MSMQTEWSMLKKIMAKLKFGTYKAKIPDDVNTSNLSEKINSDQEENKWSIVAKFVTFTGKER